MNHPCLDRLRGKSLTRALRSLMVLVLLVFGPITLARAACGDGVVDGTEQCDDGNTVSGDGCSATCTLENRPIGSPCTANNECTSSFCVDGFCCSTACTGVCQDCGAAGGTPGTCNNFPAGTDPQGECAGSASCDGSGACEASCATGEVDCGGVCADLSTDPNNCGTCGNTCSSVNGTPACVSGSCQITCNAGFDNCDGSASNGCESNLGTNPNDCGTCGNTCSSVNGTPACVSGSCQITCNAGFDNCDGSASNGCESNLSTDPNDCGTCGNTCSSVNGTPACVSGSCQITCNAGFDNCDGSATNGCESNLSTDPNDCGGCGVQCATGESCSAGVCVTGCPDADGDGFPSATCGGTDCDDTRPEINPDAPDTCNGIDDDCDPASTDGSEDSLNGTACDGADSDLCPEGTRSCSAGALVCSDSTSSALDVCNGLDDDCDPASTDGSEDSLNGTACDGTDSDLCLEGTRFCSTGALVCSDSTSSTVEVCDGQDNNCDGTVDESCGVCGNGIREPGEQCDDGNTVSGDGCSATCTLEGCPDADGDGFPSATCGGTDCDDTNAAVYPGATEVCDNLDNDCDGTVDESCGVCGNGTLEAGEQCDDGNTVSGDGCSASCTLENKAVGSPCTASSECASNFCVDGFCCSSACTGVCQDCGIASGTAGTCSDLPAGTDPHGECAGPAACDGSGACEVSCTTGQVNCGGVCVDLSTDPSNCGACGNTCAQGATCVSGVCQSASSCVDGVRNGSESDVDCGGFDCPACSYLKFCFISTDCLSLICTGNYCNAAASCFDTVKSGSETDVDCGGGACPGCSNGKACLVPVDCQSQLCSAGICVGSSSCFDGVKDGSETDVDCGGTDCPACPDGKACLVNGDCQSQACPAGICGGVASCVDGVRNGSESDVDCGGFDCPACSYLKTCVISSDCQSVLCAFGFCQAAASCFDTVKSGSETDVDCGGGACPACPDGKACLVPVDCQSQLCAAGICGGGGCPAGQVVCGGTCVDLSTDPNNCGACGSVCPGGSSCFSGMCQAASSCGNGILEAGEQCDDGNTVSGDGCSATCALEGCPDADADGFPSATCGGTDCDDTNAAVYPGATEVCDNLDNDCDGITDEGGVCAVCGNGTLETGEQCDDGNTVSGDGCSATCTRERKAVGSTCTSNSECASNICLGGVCEAAPSCFNMVKDGSETDIDCGGGACPACANGKSCVIPDDCQSQLCANGICGAGCPDADADGFPSATCGGTDCDDANAAVYPGATEVCDSLDNDCDGITDEGGVCAACGNGTLEAGEQCDDGNTVSGDGCSATCTLEGCPDADADGFPSATCGGSDCDDTNAAVYPGAAEICDNLDNDCDGTVDEACSCTTGQVNCGGACVDLSTDPNNCGACGDQCAMGEVCQNGNCVASGCPTGLTLCGTMCVDLSTDPNNCGACGNACAQGGACVNGTCQTVSSCTDGIQNGSETGIDCGGGVCPACPVDVCVGSNFGDPGQRVRVPITLDNGDGVAGFQVDIDFDPTLLGPAAVLVGADTAAGGGWFINDALVGFGRLRILGHSNPPAGLGAGPREVALVDFDIASSAPFGPMSPFMLASCVLSDAQGVQIPCNSCPQPGRVTVRTATSFRFQPIDSPVGVDRFDPLPFPTTVEALTFMGMLATGYSDTASMSVGPVCAGTLQPPILGFSSGIGSGSFSIACCLDPLLPMTHTSLNLQATDSAIGIFGSSAPFDGVAKADVNADDAVNVLDVLPAINLSLNLPVNAPPLGPPVPFQSWAANMLDQRCTVDAFINVLDIVRIRNKALGRSPLCPCNAVGMSVQTEQAAVLAPPPTPFSISLEKDGPKGFLIKVHGAADLSGLQIELKAAGPRARVSLVGLTAGKNWQASTTLDQGVLRVVAFSNAATGISGDGVVLRITGGGNPRITFVVASDTEGREIPVR